MKNIFFVSGEVGSKCFEWVIKTYPEDIGLAVIYDSISASQLCKENDLQWVSLPSWTNSAMDQDFGLGFTLWWPFILRREELSCASNGVVNMHPSLLPMQRGKHTSFWNIVEDTPAGVSLHYLDEEIDKGKLIAQKEVAKSWEDSGESLEQRLKDACYQLFTDKYPEIRSGTIENNLVINSLSTSIHLAREIEGASEIKLDSSYQGRELLNMLRAKTHSSFQGCWFVDDNKKFQIRIQIEEI